MRCEIEGNRALSQSDLMEGEYRQEEQEIFHSEMMSGQRGIGGWRMCDNARVIHCWPVTAELRARLRAACQYQRTELSTKMASGGTL